MWTRPEKQRIVKIVGRFAITQLPWHTKRIERRFCSIAIAPIHHKRERTPRRQKTREISPDDRKTAGFQSVLSRKKRQCPLESVGGSCSLTRRIAIITDIHGNLPALVAALAAIDHAGCDTVYCLGDVIGIGPYPAECLDLLLQRSDVRFVMGNHDAWFAFGLPDPRPNWMSEGEFAHHRWVHAQLDPALRAVVAQWPWLRDEQIGHLPITLLHYPRDETRQHFAPIEMSQDPAAFDTLFAAHRSPLVLFGHHHPLADITGRSRYINPGSLGCSTEAVARFALLHVHDDGTYDIAFQAEPYDRQPVIQQLHERNVPERDFIERVFFGQSESNDHLPTDPIGPR
jgi:predicted phosphodiesterase